VALTIVESSTGKLVELLTVARRKIQVATMEKQTGAVVHHPTSVD